MKNKYLKVLFCAVLSLFLISLQLNAQRPMEYLDRGVVALDLGREVYLSWRILGTEPEDIGFNIYRNGTKINDQPITTSSNFVDRSGKVTDLYSVTSVINGAESSPLEEVAVWERQPASENPGKADAVFVRIPLPEAPSINGVTYTAGDTGVGDLNGDGKYDLLIEWESDNGVHSVVDAIELDGTHLWRIDAGRNSTTGKLCMLVYDLDEDGKAEVSMITGPGTIDGKGNHLSKGPAANDDNNLVIERVSGNLMDDPSYITVFNGETGEEMNTINFWPPIGPRSEMKATWGDDYGHRASSLKAAVLYIKDLGPVVVYARGVYTRIAMAAYHWDGQELNEQWKFDSEDVGNGAYRGEGNHSVSVGDVDGDGSDELIYGAMAIDHDGTGLYATGFGHGDADHLADHMPDRPGLEFFQPHENNTYGISMRDAGTGEILWEIRDSGDIGRSWAADVDPNYRGSEVVAIGMGNFDKDGNPIPTNYNAYDQPIYFDGDVQRELRNGSNINGSGGRMLTGWYYGATTIHGSKKDANLVADILGDWREEIIFPHINNRELLLFSSWVPTERKNYTLMHDPLYRMNIVRQSIGYNQPAHTGFYFADGAPVPDIFLVGGDRNCYPSSISPFIQVNEGEWQETSNITIDAGDQVVLQPRLSGGDGEWNWSGCEISGSSAEQMLNPASNCTATATFTSSCGTGNIQEITFTITVNEITAVGNELDSPLKVYPTVSNSGFTVEFGDSGGKVTVFDTKGAVIVSKASASEEASFSVVKAGMYIVQVESKSHRKVFKVFKID